MSSVLHLLLMMIIIVLLIIIIYMNSIINKENYNALPSSAMSLLYSDSNGNLSSSQDISANSINVIGYGDIKTKMESLKSDINSIIATAQTTLNNIVSNGETTIRTKQQNAEAALQTKVDSAKTDIDNKLTVLNKNITDQNEKLKVLDNCLMKNKKYSIKWYGGSWMNNPWYRPVKSDGMSLQLDSNDGKGLPFQFFDY